MMVAIFDFSECDYWRCSPPWGDSVTGSTLLPSSQTVDDWSFRHKKKGNLLINKDVCIYYHALLFIEIKISEYMILAVYAVTLPSQSLQSSVSQS